MADKLAINKSTALKMFWDRGFNSESEIIRADSLLKTIQQPTKGYYLAKDVSSLIHNEKAKEVNKVIRRRIEDALRKNVSPEMLLTIGKMLNVKLEI